MRYLLMILCVILCTTSARAYDDNEQRNYDNLFLRLPWEPPVYRRCTQQNRNSYSHGISKVDEYALDFSFKSGIPVVAAADGIAYMYSESETTAKAYGNHIKVDHGFFYTLYAHLSSFESELDEYEIPQGMVIGHSGATGWGNAPHLHFGLYYGKAWEDGYSYSVPSKIEIGSPGTGPYQILSSLDFKQNKSYLSNNFDGEMRMIVCDSKNKCDIADDDGQGGYVYTPWEGYKNAVGIDSVRGSEEGEDDWEYVIEVPLDDIYDMDFRVKLKRKGGVWPDEVEASFYLSEDDIFDSGDVFLGSEDKDLSDEAEKKRSVYVDDVDMADFINEPGEYYVYVAVAYGTGTNRSTSRDKKERVKIIVTNETPLSDGTFIWSPNGAVPGMTCTQWQELADPHSWGDNFLCTTRNEDIRWSADGPIAGMRCTHIYESQDPHFQNNYLCVPNESELNFVWSESGNMSDMYCVRTDEPKDKHSWDDNYLCWSDSGANGAGLSGIYYGAYDTVTSNTGATSPDVLPASIHLNDASGNVRAIYTPAEVPTLPGIAARIENIGALPSSSEQKHKLKTSVFLTGPGYESGWKFSNTQTKISGFGTPGYAENIAFALPSDAVLNEGLYSITVSTDDTDKLTESNELNNSSPQVMFWVQNALPDIAVQTLSVDEDLTEVEAGSKHDITIDVSNIAPVGGDAHFPVVVQLWYDGDQLLGEQVVDAADLIAGGSTEITISGWTVPFEEGAHTLTATATNKYVPYEANLSNNTLAQDITITVTPGDPDCVIVNPMEDLPETGSFDLATTFIEFPDTVTQGDELHPKAQMCGVSGSSPKTRAMWAYARCDGTGFTHFDGDTDGGKNSGECVTEENIKGDDLATMDPGMYVIYFIANGVTLIPESDHSNNVQAKAFLLEE